MVTWKHMVEDLSSKETQVFNILKDQAAATDRERMSS